jgi:hypothetical protein
LRWRLQTDADAVVLQIPQPSDDPNDPLNWPLWKRDLITFILSMTAIFATALGPILAANTLTLSLWFLVPFGPVAQLTGYFLLGVGVGGFFIVPSARIWGKRHAFIFGTCILIGSSVWAGEVGTNFESMRWARIIQGLGCAPFESLVNAAVGDLYFVHQRGKRMAFTNLAVFGGAFFTPILVGKITHTIMWWWSFYFVAIFCAACLPAIIFFCPETAYRRDQHYNTDLLAADESAAFKEYSAAHGQSTPPITPRNDAGDKTNDDGDLTGTPEGGDPEKVAYGRHPAATTGNANGNGNSNGNGNGRAAYAGANTPKKTWVQELAVFTGRKTDESFWKLALRPFPLFLQPAFLWACLIQGTLIGWTVFIGVIMAEFFIGFPLWWDEVNTGYAYTGAFIGALGGFVVAGGLADWSAKWLTKRNGGIYEPEFRLFLVIPQLIFGVMGLYGFGITIDGMFLGQFGWAVPLMFFGFEVAGMVIGAVAGSLYIVDAYRTSPRTLRSCLCVFGSTTNAPHQVTWPLRASRA